MALLEVSDLSVDIPTGDGVVQAVRQVSFEVEPGRLLGVVGESGSGKSVMVQALMGLMSGADISGTALFGGRDLLAMKAHELQAVRGNELSMIFQDPLSSLHPHFKVGWQIVEQIRAHRDCSRAKARTMAIEMLDRVGIPHPQQRIDDYPHQFSGGMRQRVMIAMALVLRPALVIADEPTTALDATVQAQILELLDELRRELGTAVIMISHDLGVLSSVADDVMVMYAGHRLESGGREELFTAPRHPYTVGLLASSPHHAARGGDLVPISGRPPSLITPPSGCVFHPRCAHAMPICTQQQPPVRRTEPAHESACWLDTAPARPLARLRTIEDAAISDRAADHGESLVRLDDVSVQFGPSGAFRRARGRVHAVDGVSLELKRGSTLGLVGESGCGKSTLARALVGLQPLTSGTVYIDGRDIASLGAAETRALRRDVQIVFQDPYGTLNPRRRIGSIIGDPLRIQRLARGEARKQRVQELMELVGLNPEHYNRFPAEFSGGQRQRIGIARALALRPKLIVCDEPVSALDVSIQAQILNLMKDLQREFDLTYLFISHDMGVVRHVCDDVAVMYLGKIVEVAPADQIYDRPAHPYTYAMMSAVLAGTGADDRERIVLRGDPPSPLNPPGGCRFHPRCFRARERCAVEVPLLRKGEQATGDQAHSAIACHYPIAASGSDPLVTVTEEHQ